jgi:cytochrome P450
MMPPLYADGRDVEWGDLSRLPYLSAVIKESLRLFAPSAGCSGRIAECDVELCGYNIPKVGSS